MTTEIQTQSTHPQFGDRVLLRVPDIIRILGISRSTWWAGVKSGRFPQPVKLSPGITAWWAHDIAAVLNELKRGSEAKKAA